MESLCVPSPVSSPPPQVAGFRLPFVGPPLHRRGAFPPPLRCFALLTVAAWYPCPAAPVRGKASILSACVFVHPCPGERGRRGNPKDPALSCRRQPPRRVPPRNASRLVAAYRLLLPGKQPPRPRGGHGSCPGNGRQVTANTGSRPSRRVLTRGHALRACPLFAPFPPRPPSPMRYRAPISGRNMWGAGGFGPR